MAITVYIRYTGSNGSAQRFAQEMLSSGIVRRIREEAGYLRYSYYQPLEEPETVLLIDRWTDQQALDRHHASPMMQQIIRLREKYGLAMAVQRFVDDETAIPEQDRAFIL